MEKIEFLEQQLFEGASNLNTKKDDTSFIFSESDFEKVLDRAKHFGVGIYTIETFFKEKAYAKTTHEDHKKKATDYNWYLKSFQTFKKGQAGLQYKATYKVSPKLLTKDSYKDEEE